MLTIRQARVPVSLLPLEFSDTTVDPLEPTALCDIHIGANEIVAVQAVDAIASSGTVIEANGKLVLPGYVDAHTHLDKTHTWFRAPNRSGTFEEALDVLFKDKKHWSAEDLLFRGDFALRTAWAQGTRVLRTHVDTFLPQAEVSHAAMAELRARWEGRIELQTVPLCGMDAYAQNGGEQIANLALRFGASAIGGFARQSAELAARLDRLLAIASERKVGIDLHIDETGDAAAECLRAVAEAVLRNGYEFPVVCGHCCSLARQSPERQRSTFDLVKESGIAIISLPLCNLYLQDRRTAFPTTPSWRGITLVRDFLEAGVPVACASDNVRDAFYAYGDYDMTAIYAASVQLAHLDGDLGRSIGLVTSGAARIVGCHDYGRIAPGCAASVLLFETASFSELISRPRGPQRRVEGETVHSLTLPDFSELRARPGLVPG